MGRLRYAVPEDVVRLALGGVVARAGEENISTAINNNSLTGTQDDREYFTTTLERAESRWDREATPMRAVPVGSDSVPKYHSAKGKPWPIRLFLDHMNVHPLDASLGDFLELRTGRDQYKDVTGNEGTVWTADYGEGIITVHRAPGRGQLPSFYRIRNKFAKISYHISAGGDFSRAGETTISNQLNDSDTGQISVADASRLPDSDEPFLLGGSEYLFIDNVDHANDTVSIGERGINFTPATSHSSGTTLHFCPAEVRDAVGLIAAVRYTRAEDFNEAMFDGDIDRDGKIEAWNDEIDRTINNYATRGGYA